MIRVLKLLTLIFALMQVGSVARTDPETQNAALNALGKRKGAIVLVDIKTGKPVAEAGTEVGRFYPPGSIAKVVTAYAGLKSGTITATTRQTCRNIYTINGAKYACSQPGGHGSLYTSQAISESCNVWFYKSASQIGKERIRSAWASLVSIKYPDSMVSVQRMAATAEGLRVSPMQMAKLASSIARQDDQPKRDIASAMRQAATTGTAKLLKDSPLKPAVKTGSAQHINSAHLRHGWLIGFYPYDKPKYAFSVFCLEGNAYESSVPVARDFLKRLENVR